MLDSPSQSLAFYAALIVSNSNASSSDIVCINGTDIPARTKLFCDGGINTGEAESHHK